MTREVKLVLVAEDDPQLQRLLCRLVESWGYEVICVSSCAAAEKALARGPDVVLLDVHLEDGSAVPLARDMAALRPAPEVIVVSGDATPAEAFELAQSGVRAYVPKPFESHELRRVLDDALSSPPDYAAHARHAVPTLEMRELLANVRVAAIDQAISMAGGNYTLAARILGVSRQAVQQIMRERRL